MQAGRAQLSHPAGRVHRWSYRWEVIGRPFAYRSSARYLRDAQHADARLCRLVAHHSCAIIEAEERGLANILSLEFEPARISFPAC